LSFVVLRQVRIANASADGAVLVTDLACRAILQENVFFRRDLDEEPSVVD
jgi:hypothetical protein